MKGILVLEDGSVWVGSAFGAEGEAVGDVVFNTQVVGYQEILTDPAYQKNIVVMGYPHIGNYGINARCHESDKAHAAAMIVKEYSKIYSNWQATGSLGDFMRDNNVIGIEAIDTRALTVHIRENGEMRGIVSTGGGSKESLLKKLKEAGESNYKLQNFKINPKHQSTNSKTIIINLGVNNSTLARFHGAAVVSHDMSAEDILGMKPEQVVISSGPGEPRKMIDLVDEVKKLAGKVPLYGIQNGACVLALALGCSVYKMKVGHHGVNHPVVDPKTGVGEISIQNHSYGIDKLGSDVKVSHVNLNDKTIEKFETKDGKCVGTLYFPIDERGKLAPGYKYV